MNPGRRQRPPIIPKQLEENLNPGQIVVELKLTQFKYLFDGFLFFLFIELMMSNEYL